MSFQVNNVPVNAPVGTIVAFVNENIPSGWLRCNGTQITIENYPELYTFLEGSGGVVNLPDLDAYFLRSIGSGSYNSVSYNGPSSIKLSQLDSIRDHIHSTLYSISSKNGGGSATLNNFIDFASQTQLSNITYGIETRPINYGIVWIIKA